MINETLSSLVTDVDQCNPRELGRPVITYLDISSVDNCTKRFRTPQRIAADAAPSRARQLVHADDVLVSTVRPNLNAVALVPADLDGEIASTGFCVLRSQAKELFPQYLFYFTQSAAFITRLTAIANGASYPAVTDNDILETRVPLPDLIEQRRIGGLLEQADWLVRTRRYALELTGSLLSAAFLELFGDPVQNANGWPVVPVEEAGAVQLGRQRAPKYQTGQFRKPYIRVANVYENEIDLSDLLYMDFDASDCVTYALEHGDILLNEGQSTELVGRPAMWREEMPGCCFQNTLLRFQADRKVCEPAYALWLFIRYLHMGEFAKLSAKTSNVAHLGAYRLTQMRFPLPPLPLQQKFAALVEQVERLRAAQREALRQAEHLFASLLDRAFNG